MSVAIVGVIPLFSILWTEAVETPARRASSASDQPRSARAAASLAPSAETVRSMSGRARGVIFRLGSVDTMYRIVHIAFQSATCPKQTAFRADQRFPLDERAASR